MRSQLCIYDLAQDQALVLLDHDGHIEAPNWHTDGYLTVNGGGLIYRIDLNDPKLEQIDTGFATACNNDHGISPDGKTLAISAKDASGQSCIYTLPVTGGTPQQVTEQVPSYWHGWSPGGATLSYVGKRGGPFGVLPCPVGGGDETSITQAFDHCDGPDYTPYGVWIWFNGERDGRVDLWRIRPDGSDLQQMTYDAAVNWFAHPSPDSQHVLYLAYPAGTQGHPANLPVTLRLMPASGGTPRDLVHLHGGQGTINMLCRAPDSRRFAFMRFVT